MELAYDLIFIKYFEIFVKGDIECTLRDNFSYATSGYSREELRKTANLISKNITLLIYFVKGDPRATCR